MSTNGNCFAISSRTTWITTTIRNIFQKKKNSERREKGSFVVILLLPCVYLWLCAGVTCMTFILFGCYNKCRWHPDTRANTSCWYEHRLFTIAVNSDSLATSTLRKTLVFPWFPSIFLIVKVEYSKKINRKKNDMHSMNGSHASPGEPIYLMSLKYSCCARSWRLHGKKMSDNEHIEHERNSELTSVWMNRYDGVYQLCGFY